MKSVICNSESVKGILDGRKTQTRRTRGFDQLNDPASKSLWHLWKTEGDTWTFTHPSLDYGHAVIKCPYGIPGDSLWVRETWNAKNLDGIWWKDMKRSHIGYKMAYNWNLYYRASDDKCEKWLPSIHMPKDFSRITLEIKDVRVERVQDITEEDAIAEGMYLFHDYVGSTAMEEFEVWWNSINAKRGFDWKTNPFVWVLGLEAI